MNNKLKSILIVDDEELLLKALSEKFIHQGFTVYQARDGEEGIKLAFEKRPDAILLDIIMPKMTGIEMMKEVRKDEWGKHVPIILSTNVLPDDSTTTAVFENEPSYYLVKSDTEIDDVVAKVKEVIEVDKKIL